MVDKDRDQLEMELINKDAMIASLLAERMWVRENCCKECLGYFDEEGDDASILIQEWKEGKR
jgi:hypothetical protein